ncbi:MAG: peptidylprolyl isomerase, partial [Neisseria elongata]
MNKTAKLLLAAAFAVSGLTTQAETLAEIDTNYGTIKLSLDEQRAPKTVANFVRYAEKGFYNNTVFHRVIDGFMIQGGGFTADLTQKSTDKAISNEAGNGLKNTAGTIALSAAAVARTAATARKHASVLVSELEAAGQ